jgi:hypothetical protein
MISVQNLLNPADFAVLHAGFQAPIAALNCGDKCSPHNDNGVPFCCDQRQAVPSAYAAEWEYLRANTDLWHEWEGETPEITAELRADAPPGQVLIGCLGHLACQRNYRALTCRAFPFYPYVTREGEFIGLSYYWQYEDRCWVISNLAVVTAEYRTQFIDTFDRLFEALPEEKESFRYHSIVMRRVFGRKKRAIPLLHRNGGVYKITPRTGQMRRLQVDSLPKFGPYKIAAELPFEDERSSQ